MKPLPSTKRRFILTYTAPYTCSAQHQAAHQCCAAFVRTSLWFPLRAQQRTWRFVGILPRSPERL